VGSSHDPIELLEVANHRVTPGTLG
jgi:hypothetical protein